MIFHSPYFFERVPVYEAFVEGAEGFTTATKIIPFLVGMLVAIRCFQCVGAMEVMANLLKPVTDLLSIPRGAAPGN